MEYLGEGSIVNTETELPIINYWADHYKIVPGTDYEDKREATDAWIEIDGEEHRVAMRNVWAEYFNWTQVTLTDQRKGHKEQYDSEVEKVKKFGVKYLIFARSVETPDQVRCSIIVDLDKALKWKWKEHPQRDYGGGSGNAFISLTLNSCRYIRNADEVTKHIKLSYDPRVANRLQGVRDFVDRLKEYNPDFKYEELWK